MLLLTFAVWTENSQLSLLNGSLYKKATSETADFIEEFLLRFVF